MSLLEGFPPLLGENPRVLVLGSMPGVASLRAQEYYGHPQNAFWWIMQELFGIAANDPYPQRCEQLTARGVAVWDVLSRCRREGSLDTAIDRESEQAHDFATLLRDHPTLGTVFFNGAKAEQAWQRHVAAGLDASPRLGRLPSTSPAHASLRREQKLEAWRGVADALRD